MKLVRFLGSEEAWSEDVTVNQVYTVLSGPEYPFEYTLDDVGDVLPLTNKFMKYFEVI